MLQKIFKNWQFLIKYVSTWNSCNYGNRKLVNPDMKVLTDQKGGNPLYSAIKPLFSSCLDQVWHILFPNILLITEEICFSEENFIYVNLISLPVNTIIISYYPEYGTGLEYIPGHEKFSRYYWKIVHLKTSYMAIFSLQEGWPYKRGTTVLIVLII
jgi:hypothetical protein